MVDATSTKPISATGLTSVEAEKAKANALFLSIGDGAIVTDETGRIERVNAQAQKILGFNEAELVGQWFPKVIIAEDENGKQIQNIGLPVTQAILNGESVNAKSFYRKKDGTVVPVEVTVSPVLLNGKPVGAIELFRDYSEDYALDQMKSQFISLASHQLRTPLTSIMLNAHMLEDGYAGKLTDEQRQLLSAVIISSDRMTELVTMLLNITRVEAGKVSVKPEPAKLNELLGEIINEVTPKAKEKNITIANKAVSALPQINTDKAMVKEVFANLLTNAIKYTPPGGKITTDIQLHDGLIYSGVRDTGYGIPEEEQDKLFSKFYRGSNIIKQEVVGTGLGLYLVKQVVEMLGGQIDFKSKQNEGTLFWFSLPVSGSQAHMGTTVLENTKLMT